MPTRVRRLTTAFVLATLGVLGTYMRGAADDKNEERGRHNGPPVYPAGPLGQVVRLGEAIVRDAPHHPASKAHSGNALSRTVDKTSRDLLWALAREIVRYPAGTASDEVSSSAAPSPALAGDGVRFKGHAFGVDA